MTGIQHQTPATFPGRLEAAKDLVARIGHDHQPAVFACSFSIEDVVLLDLLLRHAPQVEIFTLDTGRLPQETHDLIAAYADRGHVIRVLLPQPDAVEQWTAEYGVNGFRHSLEARRACCEIRKVRSLDRALAGKKAWLTGLRRAQSVDRQGLSLESVDEGRGLLKFNPLLEWSDGDVRTYAQQNALPVHALYDRGYASIGCAPCTRAIAAGEDVRAGRWWWEGEVVKECGLHARPQQRNSAAEALS
ncbi:MAG: phosphoadenylyl-sulfate reductase [Burkholderiales bacterium]|nr:phosphoadenylyl-sulfate reductase [Burkholderiales bacterium]